MKEDESKEGSEPQFSKFINLDVWEIKSRTFSMWRLWQEAAAKAGTSKDRHVNVMENE